MAVTVQQHDVAGSHQRLGDDLVGRRRSVGDEVRVPRAISFRRELLGVTQRTGGFQQRVETATRRRCLGHEHFQAVKADHVLDPVRVDDGLALRDRQGVEDTRGPVAVLLERAEERGAVACLDTLQDRQVQLEHAFPSVEHPAEVLTQAAGDVLHVDLGHQVEVEFRAQLRHRRGQDLCAFFGRIVVGQVVRRPGVDELRQRRQIPGRLVRKAPPDYHRLQVHVEPCRDERLVAAGHHHEFVDEFVVRASPFADLVAQCPFLGFGHLFDYEHFEVGAVALCFCLAFELTRIGRKHVELVGTGVLDIAGAIRLLGQRSVDPCNRLRELVVAASGEKPLNSGELRRARIGPIGFQSA